MAAGGYAQAVLGVIDALSGASADAAYEAAYGQYYTSYQQMHNAANQKVAAEATIAAITQEKIHTDNVINMKQDQAEAQAQVMAAVSGTEGQSVEATIYQTEVNSSVAKSNTRKIAEQSIDQQLAAVYNAQSTMLAVDNPQVQDISMTRNLMNAGASMMTSMGDQFIDEIDTWGSGDTGTAGAASNYDILNTLGQ